MFPFDDVIMGRGTDWFGVTKDYGTKTGYGAVGSLANF